MHFGVLLNKSISEWQGQNFPCYNKMNRNGARTVADQIVLFHQNWQNFVDLKFTLELDQFHYGLKQQCSSQPAS